MEIWETEELRELLALASIRGGAYTQQVEGIPSEALDFKTKHDTDMYILALPESLHLCNVQNTTISMCSLIDQNPSIVCVLDSYCRSAVSVVQKATSRTLQGVAS